MSKEGKLLTIGLTRRNWPIDIGPNNAFANRVNSIISQLLHKPINCTIKLNALIAAKVADEIEPQKYAMVFAWLLVISADVKMN